MVRTKAAALCATVWAALALHAQAADAPRIAIEPGTLEFPQHTVGTNSATRTVTLTNPGAGPLDLYVHPNRVGCLDVWPPMRCVAPYGWDYDFPFATTCGRVLEGGASCTIDVTFSPVGSGARAGSIVVYSPLAFVGTVRTSGSAAHRVVYDEAVHGELPATLQSATGRELAAATLALQPGPNTVRGTSTGFDALRVIVPPGHALDAVLAAYDNDFDRRGLPNIEYVQPNPYALEIAAEGERSAGCGAQRFDEKLYWPMVYEFAYDAGSALPAGAYRIRSGTDSQRTGFANAYTLTFVVTPLTFGDGFETCVLPALQRRRR